MPQSMINQVEDMSIKEDRDEDLIFTKRNRSTLELYDNDFNTHDVTARVYNNYNNYNSNNAACILFRRKGSMSSMQSCTKTISVIFYSRIIAGYQV